jgi:hypothetical protein
MLAVNSSDRPTTISFRVDALGGRPLAVLGEIRTIKPAKKVYFRDTFAPYQVHVCTSRHRQEHGGRRR